MYDYNQLIKMKKDDLIGIILDVQKNNVTIKRICANCSWYKKNTQYNNYLCTIGNSRAREATDSCYSFNS